MFGGVCRAFYDLVFSMRGTAAFVVVDTSTDQTLHASSWLLERAIEVHWSFFGSPGWLGFPWVPSDHQVARTNSFRIMLPLLSGCGNLSSLVLTGIVVSGEHQQVIYSLPHLRKITLRSARFRCTDLEIPKHNVTHLLLFNAPDEEALSHILRQTSSTLESLRVSDGVTKAFSHDTPRCPRLTAFTYINTTRSICKGAMTFMQQHSSIRVLRLYLAYTDQTLGPNFLHNLTKVTTNGDLGGWFFARPELKEFYQHPNDKIGWVDDVWSCFERDQRSRLDPPQLEQLRIAVLHESDDSGALPIISYFFGKTLRKLHIWIEKYSLDHSHDFSYLVGGWSMLMGPRSLYGSQATVKFARLRSIRVSFKLIKGIEFPEATCRQLLRDSILPLCPVLEEASFTALSSYETIEQEEPEDEMELRIGKNGGVWDLTPQG